jgi:hypothetical protein
MSCQLCYRDGENTLGIAPQASHAPTRPMRPHILAIALGWAAFPAGAIECPHVHDIPGLPGQVTLRFERAVRSADGRFMGTFSLENLRKKTISVVLASDGGPVDNRFDFQYLDIAQRWVSSIRPIGTVVDWKKVTISPGEKISVTVGMPEHDSVLEYGGGLRLVIRLESPHVCAASQRIRPILSVNPQVAGYEAK